MVVKKAITEGEVRSAPKKESKVKPKKKPMVAVPKDKPKFDVHSPVFKTKMEYVYKWLAYMNETYEDPNDEYLSWDEYMVWLPWLRDEQFYRENKIPWTLLSAHERLMMGLYDPISKTAKDDNDKP